MSERLFVPPGAEDFKRHARFGNPETQANNGANVGETMTSSNKAELTATETQAANPEDQPAEAQETNPKSTESTLNLIKRRNEIIENDIRQRDEA